MRPAVRNRKGMFGGRERSQNQPTFFSKPEKERDPVTAHVISSLASGLQGKNSLRSGSSK
jgi:hypothetical protein